jgi:hypothetical protein
MTVSVVFPWRAGCLWREASYRWVAERYATLFPDWELVEGTSPDGPFSRAAAILDGARKSSGDLIVVADADVWCDPTAAVDAAAESGWAIPHKMIHRLSEESSALFMAGAPLEGLGLDQSNRQDSKPYRGHECGTLVVLQRELLFDVPPDPRFIGWGQEDDAWSLALRTLAFPPVRFDADLVHLWHPAQPRISRIVGTPEGKALHFRYQRARNKPQRMRALIEEAA